MPSLRFTFATTLLAAIGLLSSCQPVAPSPGTPTPNWTHPADLAASLHTPTLTLRATRHPSLTAGAAQGRAATRTQQPTATATKSAYLATLEASASSEAATRLASFSPTPSNTPTSTPGPITLSTPTPPLTESAATVTPAPTAACPIQDPSLKVQLDVESLRDLQYGDRREDVLLDFFNRGGTTYTLRSALSPNEDLDPGYSGEVERLELTNDGQPEILVTVHNHVEHQTTRLIYSCQQGQMTKLLTLISNQSRGSGTASRIQTIEDINGNGLPELVVSTAMIGASATNYSTGVYEWDGKELSSLVDPGWPYGIWLFGGGANVGDPDQDGQKELTAFGVLESQVHRCGEITTTITDTWEWNGEYYVRDRSSFPRTTYRLQAVMEGDWALLHQRFDQAASAYQAAIFDESLQPSNYLESGQEYCAEDGGRYQQIEGFSALQERAVLEAYSRFRLVQLHLLQGNLATGRVLLSELEQRFPAGATGAAFAQLARTQFSALEQGGSTRESCDLLLQAASATLPELHHPINHIRLDLGVFPTNLRLPMDRYLCPFE